MTAGENLICQWPSRIGEVTGRSSTVICKNGHVGAAARGTYEKLMETYNYNEQQSRSTLLDMEIQLPYDVLYNRLIVQQAFMSDVSYDTFHN